MNPLDKLSTALAAEVDDRPPVTATAAEIFEDTPGEIAREEHRLWHRTMAERLSVIPNDELRRMAGAEIARQRARQLAAQITAAPTEEPDDGGAFFLTRDQLATLPPVEPLLCGVLNRKSLVWLSGKFGTYKSFLALAWGLCIAAGRPWEGREVAAPGPVVYVAAEGAGGLLNRVEAWESAFTDGEPVKNLITTPKGIDPRDPAAMARLERHVTQTGAVLVVFDTLHRCAPGLGENDNTELGDVIGALQRLINATGCTVLVLHHTGYNGEHARGASSQEDDADDAYVIKLDGEDRSPANPRTLVRRKSKEGAAGEHFELRLIEEGRSAYVTLADPADRPETNVERISRQLDELGVPRTAGRPTAERALKDAKIPFDVNSLAMAIKIRKR